jgi:hypothetical protein
LTGPFRCAADSLGRSEPVAGTASTVRAFCLLEFSGAWGTDILRDSRLPGRFRQAWGAQCETTLVRPLLIRRHGRSEPDGCRVFLAYAHRDRPWVETARLDHLDEVLGLDLASLGAGRSVGLEPHDAPLFCVCTHGRHDACCAERGRPVARALSHAYPEETWEVSHIGGDRFAGNVLVLPDGLYYGRVEPESAARLAADHLDGRLDLDRLRGRSAYGMATQSAEIHLRRHIGESGLRALRLLGHERSGDLTRVVFDVAGRQYDVRVRTFVDRDAEHQLTCRAVRRNPVVVHDLVAIEPR